MKKNKVKDSFLAELKKVPIVGVACEVVGVSRNSVYRWRNTDEKFRQEMDVALHEGEELVNDMSESQLLALIRDKNYAAISFWLKHRNPKFRERLEVTTVNDLEDKLTPAQEAQVKKALEYGSFNKDRN